MMSLTNSHQESVLMLIKTIILVDLQIIKDFRHPNLHPFKDNHSPNTKITSTTL